MQKRGQVTIFLVLAIIVLLIGSTYLILTTKARTETLTQQKEAFPEQLVPLELYVTNCLKESSWQGISKVLSTGGYYHSSPELNWFNFTNPDSRGSFSGTSAEKPLLTVPYYFYNSEISVPSLDQIEKEAALAAADYFSQCVDNFSLFEEQGIRVMKPESKIYPSIEINFLEKKTALSLIYPLVISYSGKIYSPKDFSSEIELDFPKIHRAVTSYLEDQKKNKDLFLAGEWAALSVENNFNFILLKQEQDLSTVVSELNLEEKHRDRPILYSFALHYDWSALPQEEESPFLGLDPVLKQSESQLKGLKELGSISQESAGSTILSALSLAPSAEPKYFEIRVNKPGKFTYQINSSLKSAIYNDDAEWFAIDPRTGVIEFDPLLVGNGEHLAYVTITYPSGKKEVKALNFRINVNPGSYPIVNPLGSLTVKVGHELNYTVIATNPAGVDPMAAMAGPAFGSTGGLVPFSFSTNSYLFTIHPTTGNIVYTPKIYEIGNHTFIVYAENQFGKTWEEMKLEVQP